MREYIETHTRLEDVSGEVTTLLAFDYESSTGEFHDVQDRFQDVITTTTHTDYCHCVPVRPHAVAQSIPN